MLLFSSDALEIKSDFIKEIIFQINTVFSVHQKILRNQKILIRTPFLALIDFWTLINVFWAAHKHIRIISEGSCDTEDWSNDAENSKNYILK